MKGKGKKRDNSTKNGIKCFKIASYWLNLNLKGEGRGVEVDDQKALYTPEVTRFFFSVVGHSRFSLYPNLHRTWKWYKLHCGKYRLYNILHLYTGCPISYHKYKLQITQPFHYRYVKLQFRFAVISGSPSILSLLWELTSKHSKKRKKNLNLKHSILGVGKHICIAFKYAFISLKIVSPLDIRRAFYEKHTCIFMYYISKK